MATLTTGNLTLLDLAKRTDPDGSSASIIEALQQTNEILTDISFKQGNLETGHRATIRTGIPTPTWRRIGRGTAPTKSRTAQVDFGTGMLEMYSEVDVELLNLAADPMAIRSREDMAHMQGMMHEFARTLFYGDDAINPDEFTGLAHYYSDKSAESSDNIIDAGGTGSDNASIFLVGWSDMTISGIVPKNGRAGLSIEDKGIVTSENAGGTGKRMDVARSKLHMKGGLAVEDWRYGVRIANIDRSALTADASAGDNLPELMFQAMERLHSMQGVRPVFYMDRALREKLRQQLAASTKNSTLQIENVGGVRTAFFQEVPVRICDALAVDEARVV